MKKFLLSILICTLLAFVPIISNGQERDDSLSFYLALAGKNNPSVLEKFSQYQSSLEKIPQAGSLPDPEITLEMFLSPMELLSGTQVGDISLMQMFPWFGTLRSAKKEMSMMAGAGYESFRETRQQVFFDVRITWYELYKVKQEILSYSRSLEILKSLERLSLVKFRNGAISSGMSQTGGNMSPAGNLTGNSSGSSGMGNMETGQKKDNISETKNASPLGEQMNPGTVSSGLPDLYNIQIELSETEYNLTALQNKYETLTAKFNSLINRPFTTPVAVPDSIGVESMTITAEAVLDTIEKNNPMIAMVNYEGKSLDARHEMVNKMGYPMIGLGLNYALINQNPMSVSSMNGNDMIMPMVKITLPIYRKKYRAMQVEAELQKTSVTYSGEALKNSLKTEYYFALQEYRDAISRVTLYKSQLQLVKKSYSVMLNNFTSSGTGLAEILAIRQQFLDYELKMAEAVTDCNISIAKLRQLMASEQTF